MIRLKNPDEKKLEKVREYERAMEQNLSAHGFSKKQSLLVFVKDDVADLNHDELIKLMKAKINHGIREQFSEYVTMSEIEIDNEKEIRFIVRFMGKEK